ncbi:unnamed protein product, partial [Polarella glacialis]
EGCGSGLELLSQELLEEVQEDLASLAEVASRAASSYEQSQPLAEALLRQVAAELQRLENSSCSEDETNKTTANNNNLQQQQQQLATITTRSEDE